MRAASLLVVLGCAASFPVAASAADLVRASDPNATASRGSTVAAFTIESAILKQKREVFVVYPASYRRTGPERRYPVTIVLDGEANVPPAAAVSDELAQNGQIPEMLIVAIANVPGGSFEDSGRNRVHDMTPPGLSISGSGLEEGGDRFLDFIEQELLPAVDRQCRGGLPRTFIGHSSGGVLATWVAATRPAFRSVIAIDTPTSSGEEWLPKQLIRRAKSSPAPLRYASYEVRFGWRDETWQALTAAAPPSWRLRRAHLDAESHETMGMVAMYLGLREVFGDYSALAAPTAPTTSVLPHYRSVGAALGADVVPPRSILRHVVEDLLAEGRGAAAHDAYRLLATGYGAPGDSADLLRQIAEAEQRPPPAETVEGLLATPFPTPEEAQPYLGDWVGGFWMEADEPVHEATLRIRVEDGKVIGETLNPDAPPEFRVRRWQYMHITPAGMTWGNLNGMRPRGVMLFEGVRKGETLSGQGRFGGIDFRMPDGSRPQGPHFSFKHVKPKPTSKS